jgi:prepilin-type N-terminal cleavage/methylation domain-containing protein
MRQKTSRGFSLIEVLIALALITTLIVGTVELVLLAVRIRLKADSNMELADLTTVCLEERKTDGSAPAGFAFMGRRRAYYRGTWEAGESDAALLRIGFEIYPELEPEAVLALTVLHSRDLGF